MARTLAIAKRELYSFFVSPVAYIVVGSFALISGFYFGLVLRHFMNMRNQYQWYSQMSQNPSMMENINLTTMLISPLLSFVAIVALFITPALTMRLISEEKNQGTFELLMTSPLSTLHIVLGKYLAAILFFSLMIATHALFLVILWRLEAPEWGPTLTGYLGMLLMGFSFTSIGLFASSLTKSQIVAFIVGLAILLVFLMMGWAGMTLGGNAGLFIQKLSILEHFENFNKGLIVVSDVTYYLTVSAFFVLASCVSIESLRWR